MGYGLGPVSKFPERPSHVICQADSIAGLVHAANVHVEASDLQHPSAKETKQNFGLEIG